MNETVKFWLEDLYKKEIEEVKGTIENEHLCELGYDGKEPINPHTENIELMKEYIEVLEEHLCELGCDGKEPINPHTENIELMKEYIEELERKNSSRMSYNTIEEYLAEIDRVIFMRKKEETLIKKWLDKIGYKDKQPIGYYKDAYRNTMEIYSIGVYALIGGDVLIGEPVNVNLLKKMLTDEFGGEWKVEFFEIRGGFITI